MSLKIGIFVVLFAIVKINVSGQNQYEQKLTLYSSRNFQGSFINGINVYWPNLAEQFFDNVAQSVCVNGIWLFFENYYYNGVSTTNLMEYVYGENFCVNFLNLQNKLSSVRFVGEPSDYRYDSLTFYENTYFQGEEEYTLSDLSNLRLGNRIKSLIITGRSGWTLYSQPYYAGFGACAYPSSQSEPAFINDIRSLGFAQGGVKSVRRGCFQKTGIAIHVKPETHGTNYVNGTTS